jgi:hypothetical protein
LPQTPPSLLFLVLVTFLKVVNWRVTTWATAMVWCMEEWRMRSLGFYEMRFHDVRGGQYNGILEGVGGVSYRKSGVINGGDRQTGIEFRATSDLFPRYL